MRKCVCVCVCVCPRARVCVMMTMMMILAAAGPNKHWPKALSEIPSKFSFYLWEGKAKAGADAAQTTPLSFASSYGNRWDGEGRC